MAMNFLKILNPGGGADGSSGATGGGTGGRSSRRRVYTAEEQESMRAVSFNLSRLETLVLPEDKRAAMEQLVQLIKQHPDLVRTRQSSPAGSASPLESEDLRILMHLVRLVQTDRHSDLSLDLSLQALECLKTLLAPHQHAVQAAQEDASGEAASTAAAQAANAPIIALFVANPAYLSGLLELLDERHSVLRLYSIQCVTALLLVRREKVQSMVLGQPMGVMRMVELLSDASEVIRNETLLLLEALTRGNAPIQKIVAFNGAFEKLLLIASEERELDGGVIAEDALRLCSSLLADNSSNQFLFLEQGCAGRLRPYLEFSARELEDESGSALGFLAMALEILTRVTECIDCGPAAVAHKNASTRHALGVLVAPLLNLACATPTPPPLGVRQEVWALLAIIVEGHARNQTLLRDCRVQIILADQPAAQQSMQQQLQFPNYPHDPIHNPYISVPAPFAASSSPRLVRRPALRHLLEQACDATDALERAQIVYLLCAAFAGNPQAQLQAMMSFAPSPAGAQRAGRDQMHGSTDGMTGFGGGGGEMQSGGSSATDEDALGPVLLSLLSGARSAPANFAPGPDGAHYADRCRLVAARLLHSLLRLNADCQMLALTLPLQDATLGAAETKLLDYFVAALFASQNRGQVEDALLLLLCDWADGCIELSESVFGRYSSNLLAYLVQMSKDDHVSVSARGMATYYFALVLELLSAPPTPKQQQAQVATGTAPAPFSSSVITPALLLELITKQIGLERFKSNLAGLQFCAPFLYACELPDSRAASPLNVYRRLEAEMGASIPAGTQLSPEEEARQESALHAALYDRLRLSFAFTQRFKAVHDRSDQRLLNLFTSASAAPVLLAPSSSPAAPHAALSSSPSMAPLHASPAVQPTSTGAATGAAVPSPAMEHEIQSLREENARLKQELESARLLQSEVSSLRQQLAAAQSEVSSLRASGPGGVGSSAAAESARLASELASLRARHADLESEHNDLLVLLAEQEIELDELRPLRNSGADSTPAAAATATVAEKHAPRTDDAPTPAVLHTPGKVVPVSSPAAATTTPLFPSHANAQLQAQTPPSFAPAAAFSPQSQAPALANGLAHHSDVDLR